MNSNMGMTPHALALVWLRWLLANGVGALGGGFLGALASLVPATIALLLIFAPLPIEGFSPGSAGKVGQQFIQLWSILMWMSLASSLAGMVGGWIGGTLQGWALRPVLLDQADSPYLDAWCQASALGAGAGVWLVSAPHLLSAVTPLYLYRDWLDVAQVVGVFLASLVVGLAQWRILRHIVQRAALWVPANLVGWCVGGYAAYVLYDLYWSRINIGDTTAGTILLPFAQFILVMCIASVVTGSTLMVLLRWPLAPSLHTEIMVDIEPHPVALEHKPQRSALGTALLASFGGLVALAILAQIVGQSVAAQQRIVELTSSAQDVPLYPGIRTDDQASLIGANVFRSFNVTDHSPDEIAGWYKTALAQPPWTIVRIDRQEQAPSRTGLDDLLIGYCIQVRRDLGAGEQRIYYWEVFGGPQPDWMGTHVNIGTPDPITDHCQKYLDQP